MEIPLAQYRQLARYKPRLGDFIVWHGWLSHWYGVIGAFDQDEETLIIIYAGMPSLLFTMSPTEMRKNTKNVDLYKIRSSRGSFAVLQGGVWYV